ncbi:MAG: polysaccharide deacetylase family protein [Flavisolibacter sp.]
MRYGLFLLPLFFLGTLLLMAVASPAQALAGDRKGFSFFEGAITRGDSTRKRLALVFTGDEFGDGGTEILSALEAQKVRASFFFTGRFYRNPANRDLIRRLKKKHHYLGSHGEAHLLCCDWNRRDSLLLTRGQFLSDLDSAYGELEDWGIAPTKAHFFLPPYEWHNDSIAAWTRTMGLQLVNFSPGTLSHADYTTPADKNYRSSEVIYQSIVAYEQRHGSGLNGFLLLMHIGTDPRRTDKFYRCLPRLLEWLRAKGYRLETVDELLR